MLLLLFIFQNQHLLRFVSARFASVCTALKALPTLKIPGALSTQGGLMSNGMDKHTYRLITAGYLLLISVVIVGLPMEKKKILRRQEKLQYRDIGVTDINPWKKVYILAY